MDGQMDGWNGWMEWMDEWMDGWMDHDDARHRSEAATAKTAANSPPRATHIGIGMHIGIFFRVFEK